MSCPKSRVLTFALAILVCAVCLSQSANAALISLNRTPEPPLCVRNNGLESESYNYTITFSTIANYFTDGSKTHRSTL